MLIFTFLTICLSNALQTSAVKVVIYSDRNLDFMQSIGEACLK